MTDTIFKELNNFDVDISVIPKGIDKYMSIIVNRHITFIDSLQFYNTSLDTLASNLNDEDFNYLVPEFQCLRVILRCYVKNDKNKIRKNK